MAKTYNTIGTFTAGQVLTAAEMNELGENSNNYRVPPICVLSTTTNVTMTSANIGYAIPFGAGSEVVDSDSMHDVSTNNSRITINTAGVYALTANAGFQTVNFANSYRALFIKDSGTAIVAQHLHAVPAALNYYFSCAAIVEASSGDFFEAFVQHNDTVSRDTVTSVMPLMFSAVWIGQAS